jgi:hypothetical protein
VLLKAPFRYRSHCVTPTLSVYVVYKVVFAFGDTDTGEMDPTVGACVSTDEAGDTYTVVALPVV